MNDQERGVRSTEVAGVVGLGGMGWTHVDGWQRAGATVHVFDGDPDVRAAAAERVGDELVHDSLESLLAAVPAISVCTPTHAHLPVALAAVQAGRHVVCEKPLTRTVADSDRLIAEADAAGVQLYPAQVVRFMAPYAAARESVAQGRIGTPAVLRLTREGSPPAGDRWYHDVERSGGVIGDLMIHDIDFARWIAGEVVSVYARMIRPLSPERSDAMTHAYALLTHANGAISHLTASWARLGADFRTGYDIAGSEGLLTFNTDDRAVLRSAPPELARHAGPAWKIHPWAAEIAEFAAAFDGGPPPRVTAVDGRQALAVATAALESAESGKAMEVQPL